MTNTPPGIQLRPTERTDFPRIAELSNMFNPEKISGEEIERREQQRPPETIWQRMVACNEEGNVLGSSNVVRAPWDTPGNFWLSVIVDRAVHGQGIGSLLYENALQFAQKHQATRLECWVRDNQPESLRFAEKRGFTIYRHSFESKLDLASFDEARFAGVIEELEASGIRFFSLADEGDTQEARRRYYDITVLTASDTPGMDSPFPPYEELERFLFSSDRYYADCALIAADGDNWVGQSLVSYNSTTNSMYNNGTGVDRAYRGRKIALALKLQLIRSVRKYEITYLRTNNDSENAPMLAINRKLGYQPEPGAYTMRCQL